MRINVLNKPGMLTDEDRKQPLEHGCDHFTFKSCLDLSEPVQIIPYGTSGGEYSIEHYTRDVARFISWWEYFVKKDLNGFSGFSNVKFVPVGFVIVQ